MPRLAPPFSPLAPLPFQLILFLSHLLPSFAFVQPVRLLPIVHPSSNPSPPPPTPPPLAPNNPGQQGPGPPHLCREERRRGVLGLETKGKPPLPSGDCPDFPIQVCIWVSRETLSSDAQGSLAGLAEMEGERQGGHHVNHLEALWSSSLQSTSSLLAPRTRGRRVWQQGVGLAWWASVPVCAAHLVSGRGEGSGCDSSCEEIQVHPGVQREPGPLSIGQM